MLPFGMTAVLKFLASLSQVILKRTGMVGTGGEAKVLVQAGEVTLNGEVETRRRKQLFLGDEISIFGETFEVTEDYFDA